MNVTHIYKIARRHATLNNGVLAAAAIIVLASIWNTVGTLQKNFLLQQKVETLSQEIQIAQLETETLQLQQQYLRSSEYQELTARAKLGKALPGEKVIILPVLPQKQESAVQAAPTAAPQSNFSKWMQFFFGKRATS